MKLSAKEQVHTLSYEELLLNEKSELDKMLSFLSKSTPAAKPEESDVLSEEGTVKVNMCARRAAIEHKTSVVIENPNTRSSVEEGVQQSGDEPGRVLEEEEAQLRAENSASKSSWRKELQERDLQYIEAACYDEMVGLGYEPVFGTQPTFTKKQIKFFRQENEEGKKKKSEQLKEEDPADWERREAQKACLQSFTETENHGSRLERTGRAMIEQLWPPRLATACMVLAGFVSGFLGGLIGVAGPPLIVFFFFFEYPKAQVKANGAIIATVRTIVRLVTYIFQSPPDDYPNDSWFALEDAWLYVAIALPGIVGSPIGIYLSRYLNKTGYRSGLAGLLILNGITMIVTASIALTAADPEG